MPAMTSFFWNDSALRAAAATSYRLALGESAVYMRARARWRHVAATIRPAANGVAVGSSDAKLLEGGARPHEIAPRNQAIKFVHGDRSFTSVPVHHPGFQGSPFMAPTARAWPSIFTSTARRVFPKPVL